MAEPLTKTEKARRMRNRYPRMPVSAIARKLMCSTQLVYKALREAT